MGLKLSRTHACTFVSSAGKHRELTGFEMMEEVPHIVLGAFRQITGLFTMEIVSSPAFPTWRITICGAAGCRQAIIVTKMLYRCLSHRCAVVLD